MSLLTLDLQLPRNESQNIPRLLNGSAGQVLSWNLLYSDPQTSYYRIELFGTSAPEELEAHILEGCPQARVKIKDDTAHGSEALLAIGPARSLDFRKAFHRTSPEVVEESASLLLKNREDARELPMVKERALFISDGGALRVKNQALLSLERDGYLACKFSGMQAMPLLLDARNEEEFIKSVMALAGNVSVIRLSMLQRTISRQIVERITEQASVPVIHAEYLEASATIAAIVCNALQYHSMTLDEKVVAIVGLGPCALGLSRILSRMGASKLYGVDTEYTLNSRFEKDGGTATSLDFALERSDVVVISPGTQVLIDPKRLRENQLVLSFAPSAIDMSALKPEVSKSVHLCEEPHPIYALPGLLAGVHAGAKADIEISIRIAEVLVGRCGDNRFLPIPSESLVRAEAEAVSLTSRR